MRIYTPSQVAVAVRQARQAHRWSQAQLAQRMGASREWVIRLERGEPGVGLGMVLNALRVLGIELATVPRTQVENDPDAAILQAVLDQTATDTRTVPGD